MVGIGRIRYASYRSLHSLPLQACTAGTMLKAGVLSLSLWFCQLGRREPTPIECLNCGVAFPKSWKSGADTCRAGAWSLTFICGFGRTYEEIGYGSLM